MTRKDYIIIAAAIKASRTHPDDGKLTDQACVDLTARELARALGRDNPRFDGERFLKAAGVET